ncbi:TPA: NAD(P)-binding protein [Enterobacter hormaechei subsp. steigerwaltii]|nr:NAD(P)-binding protein [Enterobacter hormaechei subsp. steigerwaltii]HBC0020113.1 FAD-dependent oxidoreductase [Enterobacter hormaechei subsp. steigerwaltii]
MNNPKIIIVGAGLSGLYAAMHLENAGEDYLLLDARDRTGGRVLSGKGLASISEDLHVDMGATWFWPDIQPELAFLIQQLGLQLIAQSHPGDILFERQRNTAPERYPSYETSPKSYRLKGGMQALTAALRQQIPTHKILLNHQVIALSQRNEALVAKTRTEDGKEKEFHCKHVFLAVPPALAAKMTYTPTLSEELLNNWRKTPTWMAPHAKYVALYRSDFLQTQALSGDASSRVGPMVEIHDVSEPDSGLTAIFGFIGVPAKTRIKVTDTVLKQLCREQLARLFGPDAAVPEAEMLKDWATDPFTATESDLLQDVGHALPNAVPDHGAWAGKITGIASEWSPRYSGYLAGAIDAAAEGIRGWLVSSE